MKNVGRFLTFFGLFWTTLVLIFDGVIGFSVINQIRARTFSRTAGQITHSEITENSDSDGTTFGVNIQYSYGVDKETYQGKRYRYGAGSSSDSKWAEQAVMRYPVGAQADVFYNPRNPSESVLSPGLDGSDFMMLVFMTPFNMVMLGIWIAATVVIREKFSKSPNGGVKVIQDGPCTRIRLPRYHASVAGLAMAGLIGFVEIFLLAFSGGFHPKASLAETALVIAYGAGLLAALWQWGRIHGGRSDLVIDERDGTVELPRAFGRKARVRIGLSEIQSVRTETVKQNNSEGGNSYTYAPTLYLRGQKPEAGRLAEWLSQKRAQDFVDWLRPRLKMSGDNSQSTNFKSDEDAAFSRAYGGNATR